MVGWRQLVLLNVRGDRCSSVGETTKVVVGAVDLDGRAGQILGRQGRGDGSVAVVRHGRHGKMSFSISAFGSSLCGEPRRHIAQCRSKHGLNPAPATAGELVQSIVASADGRADGSESSFGSSFIVESGDPVTVGDIRSKMFGNSRSSDARSIASRKNTAEGFGSISLHQLGELNVVAGKQDGVGIDARRGIRSQGVGESVVV